MKLINQSAEILHQAPGLDGVYKHIEIASRTCYKSENKITENSAKSFVDRMIKSNHLAMLEHGTVYLSVPYNTKRDCLIDGCSIYSSDHVIPRIAEQYAMNPYSKVISNPAKQTHEIVTNLRVLIQHNWLDDLQYLCEPTEFHEKRITFRLTTSRHVAMEALRHKNLCRLIAILGQ